MKIRELKLLYFRNYTSLNIATHPSLNIFFGDNANGKTNIVESIFCLSLGKSYRTKSDTECIMFGEDAAAMSCVLNKNNKNLDIMLGISNKGKSAKIAGVKKNKLTEFVGELNVILFSPEDLQIVKGSPSLRREFINREFYQFSRIYHKYHLMYQHLLKQRNSYLKDMKKNPKDEIFEDLLFFLKKMEDTQYSDLEKIAFNEQKEIVSLIHDVRTDKPSFLPVIDPYGFGRVVCVRAKLNNARISRQQGCFLLFGIAGEKLYPPLIPDGWQRKAENGQKFIVKNKESIMEELKFFGISKKTLFPELESQAEEIMSQYKPKQHGENR